MMLYPMEVFTYRRWKGSENTPAKIREWVENVRSRAQYQKVGLLSFDWGYIDLDGMWQALEKGGPYDLAGRE
jgi:hypothetical protein